MRGVLPLTAVLFAAAAVLAQPAAAAFPGTNGPLAMDQPSAQGLTIGSVNADGTNPRAPLIAVGPEDGDPAWSPDGRRLAFMSTRDGNQEVYVLDTQSGTQTRLTFNPAHDHDPTFSPDGSRIAFASDRDGNSELYVMPASGGLQQRLTADPATDIQPAWSVNGEIVFASDRGGDFDLYAMNDQGGGVRRITTDPGADLEPSWSPDGSRIAYTHVPGNGDGVVNTIGADGQSQDQRVAAAGISLHFPTWSPDGTRLAIVEFQGLRAQLWIFDAQPGPDAPPPRQVANGTDPSWAALPPATQPTVGRTISIAATSATVLVAPATAQHPSTDPVLQAKVRSAVEVPVGTTINATDGTVAIDAITTTPDGPNTVGHAVVKGGIFTIKQGGAPGSEPLLRMARGPRYCGAFTARLPDVQTRMRIRARGRFRTVGGYGRGAGRGTEWVMRDRCDGTLFKVYEGTVLVHDYRRRLTLRVRAGQCYLAAVRRRPNALKPRSHCPGIKPPR